jgi:hypothetical protein
MPMMKTSFVPAVPRWRGRYRDSYSPLPMYMLSDQLVPETGPLGGLQNRSVLALFDVENLTISSRKLGYDLNYGALARRLGSATRNLQLHAALSVEPGDTVDAQHMAVSGFTVHTRRIERLPGGSKAANSDNLLAFQAGLLVSRARADVVILGSGDGQLVCDLANAICALPATRSVWTLSVPGATSSRVDCHRNPSIERNLEIGRDVLDAMHPQTLRRLYET